MPEPAGDDGATVDAVRERLRTCGRLLREARHLEPDTQLVLAEVLEKLASRFDEGAERVWEAELGQAASRLQRALESDRHASLLTAARHRLEEAAARAETEAPVAAGAIRKLIDALSSIGV